MGSSARSEADSDEFPNPGERLRGTGPGELPEWLKSEIGDWVRRHLISEKQARLILTHYGLVPTETIGIAKRRDLVFWVSVLGALLVGIGILLIVSANWNILPKTVRLLILLMTTAGFYFAGYHAGFASAFGKAFSLIGSLAWGASLFLVGQMYHFSGRAEAHLVGVWALGIFPLAYLFPSLPHLFLGLMTALIYLLLIWFGDVHDVGLSETAGFFLAIGTLIYLIGVFHYRFPKLKGFARSYAGVGAVLITCLLFVLSFQEIWAFAPTTKFPEPNLLSVAAGLAVILLTIAYLIKAGFRSEAIIEERVSLVALALLSDGLIFLWPLVAHYNAADKASYIPYGVLNFLLFVASIRLIFIGVERLQPRFVNYGLWMFFVLVTCRFFELFATLMTTGLLFVLGGLVLLFLGYALSQQRAHLLKVIEAGTRRRNAE